MAKEKVTGSQHWTAYKRPRKQGDLDAFGRATRQKKRRKKAITYPSPRGAAMQNDESTRTQTSPVLALILCKGSSATE